MENSERRARSFKASLENAGYKVVWKPAKAAAPWATTSVLPPVAVDMLLVIYRELGGVQAHPVLAPRGWDLQADGVLIEFDEALHFNRYRDLTLETRGRPGCRGQNPTGSFRCQWKACA